MAVKNMAYFDQTSQNLLLPFTSNCLEFSSSEFYNLLKLSNYKVLSYLSYFKDSNPQFKIVVFQLLSWVQLFVTHGLQPTRFLCPCGFPDKNTTVGCHFLLQGIFRNQGLNPHLLHWQVDSLPLNHQRSPDDLDILI